MFLLLKRVVKIKKCDDCVIGIGVEDSYIGGYSCPLSDVMNGFYNLNSIIRFKFCPDCGNIIDWKYIEKMYGNQ